MFFYYFWMFKQFIQQQIVVSDDQYDDPIYETVWQWNVSCEKEEGNCLAAHLIEEWFHENLNK